MLPRRALVLPPQHAVRRVSFVTGLGARRTYAQPAPSSSQQPRPINKPVKAPLPLYGVDGTYATALYRAATRSNNVDTIARSIEALGNLLKRDPKLGAALSSPTLKTAEKKAIAAELRKQIGDRGGDTMRNFLDTMAENNRLSQLPEVCQKFLKLTSAAKGEVEVIVTSAAPLDNRTLVRLEGAASKSPLIGQGKRMKLVPKVNPDLKGGLVLEIGDRTIDLSVSSKMAKMNQVLRERI